MQDLLRHTSGYPYADRGTSAAHKKHPGGSIKAMIERSKADTLAHARGGAPGVRSRHNWQYGFSIDILGFIVEAVTGQTLGAFLKERLYAPARHGRHRVRTRRRPEARATRTPSTSIR